MQMTVNRIRQVEGLPLQELEDIFQSPFSHYKQVFLVQNFPPCISSGPFVLQE